MWGWIQRWQRPVGQYSQGMRQRASLARVLISRPELLLLDEPFSNMDIASAHQMLRLLETFRSEQRTILLTTHQRELAEPLADYVLTLEAGAVASLEDGPYATRGAAGLSGCDGGGGARRRLRQRRTRRGFWIRWGLGMRFASTRSIRRNFRR